MASETYRGRQTEAQFMHAVQDAAARLGWLDFHFPNALCNPPGFPDLILLRDGVCIFAELKVRGGRLGRRQEEMAIDLADAGFPVRLWYPDDWPEIEATLKGEA